MKIQRGQCALVTGASRGLGVHIARKLASRGMNLVISARSTDSLEAVAAELRSTGVKVLAVQADMSNPDDIRSLYGRAKAEFGDVDCVINNAGIELVNDYLNLSPDDIQWVVNVNLIGPMLLSQLALADMYHRDSGHIVNIASAAGYFPPPYSETYSSTKAGLIGFTHSLRLSAQLKGKKVGASVIAPGYMDDAGMYEDMKAVARKAPWYISSLPADVLADWVVKVIERDKPIKLLMPYIPTVYKLIQIAMPRIFEIVSPKLGIFRTLVDLAKHRSANQ